VQSNVEMFRETDLDKLALRARQVPRKVARRGANSNFVPDQIASRRSLEAGR
jgi:hypothetical protein